MKVNSSAAINLIAQQLSYSIFFLSRANEIFCLSELSYYSDMDLLAFLTDLVAFTIIESLFPVYFCS